MNTKSYINYFNEIASIGEKEQLAILEKARHCAFVQLKLNTKSTSYLILSIGLGFFLPVVSVLFFELSIIHHALATATGSALSVLIYKKFYGTLLRKGLSKVLAENAA